MKPTPEYTSKFKILKRGRVALALSAVLGGATLSLAAPSGGAISSGSATIEHNGKITTIDQQSDKTSINWQKFGIKSDETVNFKQPDVNSIALNRVIGNERSIIDGALNANGQVWILNSNGVLFGKNAKINTAGLLATTKTLSDEDFNAGKYSFKGDSTASVINMGTIDISDSGYALLLANSVTNEGEIKAIKGTVHLTGASEATINLNGNSLVDLVVDKGVLDALVENKGAIYADGGEIYLTTNAADELLKGVVNNEGIIEANSIDGITGHVEMFAHGGEAQVGGTITALEGFVETSGKEFTFNDATIKAGEWLIDPVNVTIDDPLATAIETQLGSGDATITTDGGGSTPDTSSGESAGDGNIFVNSAITWDTAQKLTLHSDNSIYVNKAITATNDNGQVAFYYGDSGDYYIDAPINLKAGGNFFTKKGSAGETPWTVITALGSEGSTTGTDLQGINKDGTSLGKNYVLGADIDASGASSWNGNAGWTPIGDSTTKFTGNFDGLGHTIDNLTINRPMQNEIGLFGKSSGSNSSISNIRLTNIDFTGDQYVGGVIGFSYSKLSNVSASGNISFTKYAGGLVGNNYEAIDKSYANVALTSTTSFSYAGGLVGASYSDITNSYAIGSVDAVDYMGGLVGSHSVAGAIENSYSTTTVTASGSSNIGGLIGTGSGSINSSYYDKTSNTGMSDEADYGKTTEDMKDIATFSGVWSIESYTASENTYPTLAWQESSNGYTKTWLIGQKGADPTPEPDPTPTPTPSPSPSPAPTSSVETETEQENLDQVVITIANQQATRPPKIETPSSTQALSINDIGANTNVNIEANGRNTLVSQPIEGQGTRKVSMSEAKAMQIESGGDAGEVRVPLSRDSMIELVDGGVNLPEGVEQEFYVADEE